MKKFIFAIATAVALSVGFVPAAEAAQPPAKCRVLSAVTETQTRNVTGVIVGVENGQPVYGRGVQHRVKTTVTQRCRGKVSTTVAYTAWEY